MRPAFAAVLLALLVSAGPVGAQGSAPAVSIESAVPDAATGTLTIAGSGFGARPFVTLDLVPLNISLALDQRIVAVVPVEMIPPGSYLLTVTRGSQAADTASFEVRIGLPPATAPASGPSGFLAPAGASASPSAPGTSASPAPGDAAARVGDRTITLADVDREWQRIDSAAYLSASRQMYEARRRVLTDMVNNELLAREAASRGMTVDALLKEELPKRTVPLPDNAVTTLYQSLGDRARGASLDQLRPALREWLARKVEPDLAKMTYIEELTKVSTRAETLLVPPRVQVEHAADDPVLGGDAAPVELVIFGDFQSPAYARLALTLPRTRDLFGARLRIVFKHFPANDPASIAAAEAAACANRQGKFWAFHDALLGQAGALDAPRFKLVAAAVSLDRSRFDACIDGQEARDRIGLALEETRRYDLPGTPSILVNGRLAPEPPAFLPPFDYLKRLVEEEIATQARSGR
jgi:protein-disulfide isomerase